MLGFEGSQTGAYLRFYTCFIVVYSSRGFPHHWRTFTAECSVLFLSQAWGSSDLHLGHPAMIPTRRRHPRSWRLSLLNVQKSPCLYSWYCAHQSFECSQAFGWVLCSNLCKGYCHSVHQHLWFTFFLLFLLGQTLTSTGVWLECLWPVSPKRNANFGLKLKEQEKGGLPYACLKSNNLCKYLFFPWNFTDGKCKLKVTEWFSYVKSLIKFHWRGLNRKPWNGLSSFGVTVNGSVSIHMCCVSCHGLVSTQTFVSLAKEILWRNKTFHWLVGVPSSQWRGT